LTTWQSTDLNTITTQLRQVHSRADSITHSAAGRCISLVVQVQHQGCMTGQISAHNKIARYLFLLGLFTVVMSWNRAFPQMPDAHIRPDPGYQWANTGAEHPGHTNLEDELDRGFAARFRARQQHPVSGIVTLRELSHHVPGKAAKEYERAYKTVQKGDLEAAIQYFKNAIAIDPEFSAAINALGLTYLRVNRNDPAIEQFNKAIAVDPHEAAPYSNLAIALLGQEQYSDAERTARRALDLDRADTNANLVLGASLVLQKKFTAEAEQSLRRAASDYPHANFLLALGHLQRGDTATAKDHLRMYLASGEKTSMDKAKALLQKLDPVAQSKQ
jgi:tetratricopeptide (TPR) repeat protein